MTATLNPERTVAELLLENPLRAVIFERHRIDYCCNGKRSLREACKVRGLDESAIVEELSHPGEMAGVTLCDSVGDLTGTELIEHIIGAHHAFLRRELPRLVSLSQKVARAHGEHSPECTEIANVLGELAIELTEHMAKEEEILFPFIGKLESGLESPFPTIARPIDCMEKDHAEVGLALEKLRALTNSYSPPMDACNSWRVLYHGLAELERDLHQHVHEENNILFPKAMELEATLRPQSVT